MSTLHSSLPVPLRTAGWEQLDAVMTVMEQAFEPGFGEAWTRAQCAGILPMHGVRMVLAGSEREPCGFSLMRAVAGESELLLLAVSPSTRRQGIGSGLVADFIAHAQGQGAARVHLEVRDGNPAVDLYRDHGFTVAGRRANYYRGTDGRQFDALTMARRV